MEVKKSYNADLEHMRPTWFLMGVLLVLAMFYAALEFTTTDDDAIGQELSDDLMADMELLPALDKTDMLAARSSETTPAATGRIKRVETPTQQLEKNVILTDMRTVGEGSGDFADGNQAGTSTEETPTTALAPVAVDEDNNPLGLHVLEQYPEFPGGMVELMKWLNENIKYPEKARAHNIQGRVVVAFIINNDGSISESRVTTSVHPLLDREALRVVQMMPKWKPGQQQGKACRTMFVIPINFKI